MKKAMVLVLGLFLLISLFLFQNVMAQEVKDHPALSKYEGADIIAYQVQDYAPYVLGTGPQEEKDEEFRGHRRYFSEFVDLEGKVTRIQYAVNIEEGIFKVFKNYEQALKQAGYQILFTTSDQESSWPFWNETVYHHEWGINPVRGDQFRDPFGRNGFRFLSAKGTYRGNNIYFAIFINPDQDDIIITQDVIEINPMESGLVTAAKIKEDIELSGFVSIYGIYFDTDKAVIKEDSIPALKEIALFLKNHSDKKYYIVGHTDNVGNLSYNMDLSQKRAEAVMEALVQEHGIDELQIEAYGVASLAPVTSNATETGKAKNRRVELVEQ
jgi:outer membrane protein OmpA-like peptidoglycan-associated protein